MNSRRKIGAHSPQWEKRTAVVEWNGMVWNEMEDTCALSDDRMLPTQTQPTFHFSRVFGGGGWLGVRVISAVSRFCFDPLSVRSTLVAGAKNRSEEREPSKKPNRMHGSGGWLWKYTKIFRGYALGATKVFAFRPTRLSTRRWSCDSVSLAAPVALGPPDSRAGAMTAAGQSWRINSAEEESTSGRTGSVPCSSLHLLLNKFRASVLHIRCFSYLYPNIYNHTLSASPAASSVFFLTTCYFFRYLSPIYYLPVPLQTCVTACERDGECEQFNELAAIILQLLLCGLAFDPIYR